MADEYKDYEWNAFHDVVLSAANLRCSKKKLKEVYEKLPEDIKADARHWGLSDSVVRDHIYVWLKGNLPLIK